MLGIRRYNGVAIDLWCGNADDFVADFHGVLGRDNLVRAETAGHRHLALVEFKVTSPATLDELKVLLDEIKPKTVKRVTLILPTKDEYFAFQAALFAAFPDE